MSRLYESSRSLMAHQKRGIHFIRRHSGRAGVWMAPGTGKTLLAIRYAEEVITNDHPALIVCRRDDYLTWRLELIREGVPEHEITEIDSGKFDIDQEATRYNIVSYDLTKNESIRSWTDWYEWSIVIADESHYLKRWKSDRAKQVIKATRHIPRRLALTGSPITNKLEDVFSQGLFIDDGATFGTDHWKFMKKYYIRSGPGWFKKRTSKDLIKKKIGNFAFSVHEDDVLDLPPMSKIVKGAKMRGEQRRVYERMLTEWEYQLEHADDIVEVDHVIVQLSKLKQIASGFIYDADKKAHWFKSGKLEMLRGMLKKDGDLGEHKKVVIWCSFTAEIEKIAEMAEEEGWGCVQFKGGKRKDKEAARLSFKNDPSVRLFIGQVDSGVGMNELVVASDAVYFSNSFKVVSRQQSTRRTRRIGSEHHKRITYWDLLSENTVDIRIHGGIGRRVSIANEITNAIKSGKKLRTVLMTQYD